jgi:hypothetical protein
MNPQDPLLFRQLKVIQKIIQDETWLESERRGYAVSSADTVVRENVCRVVLRIGHEMRETAMRHEVTSPADVFSRQDQPAGRQDFHPQAA